MRARQALLPILLTSLLGSACSRSQAAMPDQCAPAQLKTVTKGRLTLSTGVVTRAPWVSGPVSKGGSPDPRKGQGYDAAVGFALAERLGYERDDVVWVASLFKDTLALGKKPWDVNVNQVTRDPKRQRDVDLSRPYYTVKQAVVVLSTGRAHDVRSKAGLQDLSFAVVKGSPAAQALQRQIAPRRSPVELGDFDKVRAAVSGGADAMVTDYLNALQLDADDTQLIDGQLLGVLPAVVTPAEEYSLVLEKGSPLTACVDDALEAMDEDGTLARLERKWLVEESGWTWFGEGPGSP